MTTNNHDESHTSHPSEWASSAAVAETVRAENALNPHLLEDIHLDLSVEIGGARLAIAQILKLSQGSIVKLDVSAGAPLNVYVNQVLIGQGEIVTITDQFGIKLTALISESEKAKRRGRKN